MLEPKKDLRYGVNRSELIWVIERSFSDKSRCEISHMEIISSVERTVYRIDGRAGEFVQYENILRPLHSVAEFTAYTEAAKKEKLYLFSNDLGVSPVNPDSFKRISSASFIFTDESS